MVSVMVLIILVTVNEKITLRRDLLTRKKGGMRVKTARDAMQ